MKNLSLYVLLIAFFSVGVILGDMATLPGKSESHSILNKHGIFDSAGDSYFVYMPNEDDLSTEELEALAVISNLYTRVQIVYPEVQ